MHKTLAEDELAEVFVRGQQHRTARVGQLQNLLIVMLGDSSAT